MQQIQYTLIFKYWALIQISFALRLYLRDPLSIINQEMIIAKYS